MTTQVVDAIFQNGTFHPVRPLSGDIAEGQSVRLRVEIGETSDVLALAANVYEGLSDDEVKEVETIAFDRREFFGRNEE